jgi:hypothetical protein
VHGPIRQRLVDTIAHYSGSSLTIKQLVDFVYADDPNGGPLYGSRSLNVIVHRANEELLAHGYQIKCTHPGRGARYEFVKIKTAPTNGETNVR